MVRRGFTLIEMVVVLGVLAVVTHLALRSLSGVRDARLADAADRQLVEIRDAVFSEDVRKDRSGFLADLGRLPRAADGTLAELTDRPADVPCFAVRRADREALAVPEALKGAAEPTLVDEHVYVPTGWRGPYLRLPLGRTEVTDPWGNAFVVADEAGLERLTVSNGFLVAASHYGPDARPSARRTLSLEPDGGATSRLVLSAVSRSGATGDIYLKWYGPASGMITGALARASIGVPQVFEGLTPGVRVLKAGSVIRRVSIAPGDNLVEIEVP